LLSSRLGICWFFVLVAAVSAARDGWLR